MNPIEKAIAKTREDMERDAKDEPQREKERKMRIARIPLAYRDVTLKKVPDAAPYKEKILTWHGYFRDALRDGEPLAGLYLHGPVSTGKSALAAGVATWASYRLGAGTFWLAFTEVVDFALNDSRWHDTIEEGGWSFANRCHLLVIDDFSQAIVRSNGYTDLLVMKFEELLRRRTAQGLPTIITSNAALDTYEESSLGRIADVIRESCYEVEINALNYRRLKAEKRKPL